MRETFFSGTLKLGRLVIKTYLIKLLLWIISISGFVIMTGAMFDSLYQNQAELDAFKAGLENPAMVFMFGPVFGDVYHYGAAMANQMLAFILIFVAIMSIFIVSSQTRAIEEEGLLELVRSLPIGRLANITSVMLVNGLVSGLIGLITAIGLASLGLNGMDLAGSLTFGFAMLSTGLLFGAITAVLAQLYDNNRTVLGVSFLVLGAMYVLRGIGDVSSPFLAWIIPFNWPIRSQIYVHNYLWPIFLTLFLALALIALSIYLNAIRDLEAGFLKPKQGKINATSYAKKPLGFVIKLSKTSIIAWIATSFLLGVSYGSVFGDLDTYFESNEMIGELLPGGSASLALQFMSVIMIVIAILSAVGPMMIVNRLASEEKKNHLEHLMSRSMDRRRLLSYYALVSLIAAVLILVSGILGLYSGVVSTMENPIAFGDMFKAGIAYYPAIVTFVTLSMVLLSINPRLTTHGYTYIGISFIIMYFGQIINLPDFLQYLTPFGYVDKLPIEDYQILNTLLLSALSVGFIVLSMGLYKKRDLIG